MAELMDADDFKRRQRSKNIALAVLLFAFVVLFFLWTLVKMSEGTP